MKNYGLTKHDLHYVQKKIDFQKLYLENSVFTTQSGQVKSLMDVSHSANHSVRYYAQLVNKINTMTDYTNTLGLTPVFVTATLDGFYRDLLHDCDNSRFLEHKNTFEDLKEVSRKSDEQKELYDRAKYVYKKIPDTPETNYLRSRIENNEQITVKDLYNVLNYQMKLFLASAPFKEMRKAGIKYSYIRTVEPHKDGIPHFHMMFYIAPKFVNDVKSQFVKSFTAPRNAEPLKGCIEGQLECFQWNINKPSAYVLKYVTKSFMDVKNQKEIDYIQAWFIHHRIPRCVTSHTIVPQWVFQKIQPLESDWFYLTDIANAPGACCEWSKEDDYFKFMDIFSGRTLEYNRGVYKVFYGNTVVKEFGSTKDEKKVYDRFEKVPTQWTQKTKNDFIPLVIDDKNLLYKDGKIFEPASKSPLYMKNYELYHHYLEIDKKIDTVNLHHYGLVKNELINRGMLFGETLPLDSYNGQF
ncbi:replication endonuclease [Sulfurimonas sp.]|uniref:replication endonuclease n=1 Tax=Sulfurimonas sp. TaxID=2022749 RepID=UPI0019F21EA6|nr:replication endonuclease [Sulfurimonas sp.]MBE0515163.1 replication endonuclease [Sulfurimonas sp.]